MEISWLKASVFIIERQLASLFSKFYFLPKTSLQKEIGRQRAMAQSSGK